MNTIQTSLLALLAVVILTLSMSLIADQSEKSDSVPGELSISSELQEGGSGTGEAVAGAARPELITASSRKSVTSGPEDASSTTKASVESNQQDQPHREKVWGDISQAITSLNDMVGDDMFRKLTRKNSTTMEVRVDRDYWQRVRYETRVDLKNDISNIWHLYVRQYNEDNQSAVFFVDDLSGKTIDIFTQRRRSDE